MAVITNWNNASLFVNTEQIFPVSDSVKVIVGKGEVNLQTTTGGAGLIKINAYEDPTTKMCQIDFDLPAKLESTVLLDRWAKLIEQLVLQFTFPEGSSALFELCSLTNDPEINASSDGVISFQFKGNPIVLTPSQEVLSAV